MVQELELIDVDIDRRTFWVRPVGSWVLESNNVVAEALEVSLDKPLRWAVGFFFGNTELSMGLWGMVGMISGFYEIADAIFGEQGLEGDQALKNQVKSAGHQVKKQFS